jgi:hypothetical protein
MERVFGRRPDRQRESEMCCQKQNPCINMGKAKEEENNI